MSSCLVSGCKETFISSSLITDHLLNVHCLKTRDVLHCPLCSMTCYDFDIMTYHLRSCHTHDKPYHCLECNCTFSLEANLNTHQRVRHNIKETDTLTHQEKSCHGNSQSSSITICQHKKKQKCYKCETCGKSYASRPGLMYHKKTHTGIRPFKCMECGKGFKASTHLILHKRTHTGERPYKCETCGKSYIGQSGLMYHKRTHTGIRPFKCMECGKGFKTSTHLTQHKQIHTNIRPFKCDECGKKFKRSKHLTRHKLTHTGERPYKCKECWKGFIQQYALNRHKCTRIRETL